MTVRDEREWLTDIAQKRDKQAFSELFAAYAGRLRGFFRSKGVDDAGAEELSQEVMISVWRKAASYQVEKAAPQTWLFCIARNRWIDHLRRRRPEPDPQDPHWAKDGENNPQEALERGERAQRLGHQLEQLPPEQRRVLHGLYFEGLTLADIARRDEIPLGTIKTRARLAMQRLRRSVR